MDKDEFTAALGALMAERGLVRGRRIARDYVDAHPGIETRVPVETLLDLWLHGIDPAPGDL